MMCTLPPSCASVLSDSDASSNDGMEVEGDNSSNSLFPTSSYASLQIPSACPAKYSAATNCAASDGDTCGKGTGSSVDDGQGLILSSP